MGESSEGRQATRLGTGRERVRHARAKLKGRHLNTWQAIKCTQQVLIPYRNVLRSLLQDCFTGTRCAPLTKMRSLQEETMPPVYSTKREGSRDNDDTTFLSKLLPRRCTNSKFDSEGQPVHAWLVRHRQQSCGSLQKTQK
jgi:hypothetical protein